MSTNASNNLSAMGVVDFLSVRSPPYGSKSTLRLRRSVEGPEKRLVETFRGLFEKKVRTPRNCTLTFFQEPKLPSGFPDLVAVIWHVPTVMNWSDYRADLQREDHRLAQMLCFRGSSSVGELEQYYQHSPVPGLRRLLKAKVVSEYEGRWQLESLSESFAVRKILSFEAKISSWTNVLEQASVNRWFSSESYVLVPDSLCTSERCSEAKTFGVGVWTERDSGIARRSAAQFHEQPLSYASWLFNDWIWRIHTNRM